MHPFVKWVVIPFVVLVVVAPTAAAMLAGYAGDGISNIATFFNTLFPRG